MKKGTIISIFMLIICAVNGQKYNLDLAKGAFIEGDYKTTATQLDGYLQRNYTQDEDLFAQAILAFLHEQDSVKAAQLTNIALKREIKIEKLLDKMWSISKLSATPSLFYNVKLLANQTNEPFAEAARNSLIQHYLENKDNSSIIALLEKSPAPNKGDIRQLQLLAQTYAQMNKDSLAMESYKRLITIDPVNFDANVYVGVYYYLRGKKRMEMTKPAELKGLEYEPIDTIRKEVIQSDIFQSLGYIERAISIRTNPQLRAIKDDNETWLSELVQKRLITKKEKKKIEKANRKKKIA